MSRLVLLLLALTCSTSWAQAEDAREFSQEQLAFFETKIRPVLVEYCLACHSNDDKQKGGLSLTSRAGLLRGGESGPAIAPGKPDASLLLEALRYESYEMPPKGKLPARVIDDFAKWIAMGAPDPRVESAPAKKAEPAIEVTRLWSLQPLSVVEPPQVDDVSDPIDRFIRGRLRREGLEPADPAPPRVLLRRLYLDLTGLPPTSEQVEAFEQHSDFEAVVDRLLDSPEFGERWARHWLDLSGYADTIGVGRSIPALEAWRYRDYVINAFNLDKPFDEFIRQQIAGDIQVPSAPGVPLGPEPTVESIVATGFLAIGPWELVGGDKVQLRMDVVDRQVNRVGKAFLGMTLECARCHDHKFDPVSQRDYYALAGLFRSTVTLNGRINGVFSAINQTPLPESTDDLLARAERVRTYEAELVEETRLRDEANRKADEFKKQITRLSESSSEAADIESQPTGDETTKAELEKQRDAATAVAKKHSDRIAALKYLKHHRTRSLALAVIDGPEPEDSHINIRGNAHQLGELVPRGFPVEIAPKDKPELTRGGSGRVQLAEWLTEQDSGDVSIFLSASDAGDGREGDFVVWQNPRLTIENGPDIQLRDLAGLQQSLEKAQTEALGRTADYLAAIAEIQAGGESLTEELLAAVAERRNLEPSALKAWTSYLGIGPSEPVIVTGHFDKTETHGDYNFIRSWGTGATPIVTANSSDNQVRIPGIARAHGITAHPSPTHFAAFGWQSPIDGLVRIEAQLSDAHPECGDGQEWFLQHRTGRRVGNLWKGRFRTGGSAKMQPQQVSVRKGELISFILGPSGNYTCDLTEMNLTITEVQGEKRTWDLAGDVSSDLLASNPHADRHGNPKVWHFYTGKMSTVDRDQGTLVSIPAGSLLDHWQMESDAAKRTELARQVQQLATGNPPRNANSPDGILYAQLRNLALSPRSVESLLSDVTADIRFGKHPLGHETASADLVVKAPSIVEFKIPARLASGRTLVVGGVLDPQAGRDGTVRLEAGLSRVEPSAIGATIPIVVNEGSQARARVLAAFTDFRDLFPPQLCYERIVPVDEVVTLTLFYRQDNALQRLMLDDKQTAELNRMWEELFYVAQEPLRYEVAFEQIREFATQDRPDLVKVWDPLKPQVIARADAFRKRLLNTEPAHLAAVLEFAGRAWRRPLTGDERVGLSQFYRNLRTADMSHEDAIRLTLARVLTSPAFLYRREVQSDGSQPQPVTDLELASRLSFFLWSSVPDAELRGVAESGSLSDVTALAEQTRRMLKDPRTRRLAIQFACQWLHLRGFDQDDNKNEKLYPEFAAIRGDMYEETVRFFEDMFRSNGSILDVLSSDHTFLNESLAKHYGIDGVDGPQWRRVDSVRNHGRGGVLGMASLLASQSGASRTSPILRGNWVYETLLGERPPRPPANVPQLPDDVPEGLTARQLIEKHSSVAACAKCHVKIDPFGFALEQYDAIGRLRAASVDTRTKLEDGTEIDGIEGLREYLLTKRRNDVVRQFCRKLLGFALGREVQLSDEPLLDRMVKRLSENQFPFHIAVEEIVLSDQFRKIRGASSKLQNP